MGNVYDFKSKGLKRTDRGGTTIVYVPDYCQINLV